MAYDSSTPQRSSKHLDILTYPVGLLIGLFSVTVDVGTRTEPVQLLLDGRPACVIPARAPACMVDLGPDPVIHELALVRQTPGGVERVTRWVNKPGVEAEVRALGDCEEQSRKCRFTITWAHPAKLDPTELRLALDGRTVASRVAARFEPSFSVAPRIVTVDAIFPDGRRASATRLLRSSYPQEAAATLHSVPITTLSSQSDGDTATSLRRAGLNIRTVERGDVEVTFVIEPGALERLPTLAAAALADPNKFAAQLQDATAIHAIMADERITSFDLRRGNARPVDFSDVAAGPPLHWIRFLLRVPSSVGPVHRVRTADAMAAAAYDLGAAPRRRVLVLIAGPDTLDGSVFSPAQAQAYLAETGVPIVVWRTGNATAPGWPEGPVLQTPGDVATQLAGLRRELDLQRVAWLEGDPAAALHGLQLPPGIALAGRGPAVPNARPASSQDGTPPTYALAVDPAAPGTIYTGKPDGLHVSRDGGSHWQHLERGDPGEVYTIALDNTSRRIFVGSAGAIARRELPGDTWQLLPTFAVFSIITDQADPRIALAATRGGILRTNDGGEHWVTSSRGMEKTFALSIAADPRDRRTFYAASAGSGVYKSIDGGVTWKPTGRELDRTVIRCLLVDRVRPDAVFAGTDAGVFLSSNAGRSWETASIGLPRTIVYALATDPNDLSRLFAGTAAGVFETRSEAHNWVSLEQAGQTRSVTCLAVDPARRRLVIGTDRGVLDIPIHESP